MQVRAVRSPASAIRRRSSNERTSARGYQRAAVPRRLFSTARSSVPESPVLELPSSPKEARIGKIRKDGTTPRFFNKVAVVKTLEGYEVELDNRLSVLSVNTDARLVMPTEELAVCLASDLEFHHKKLDPKRMPMYGLISSVFDATDEQLGKYKQAIVGLLESDTACIRASASDQSETYELQKKYHDPIVQWFQKETGMKLNVSSDLLELAQPEATTSIVKNYVKGLDRWALVGVHGLVDAVSSFTIASALWNSKITVHDALIASRIEQLVFESKLTDIRAQQEIKREELRMDIATTLVYLRALGLTPFGRDLKGQEGEFLNTFLDLLGLLVPHWHQPGYMELKTDQEAKSIDNIEEFIGSLEEYNVVIPDEVTEYYLKRSGFHCPDVRIKRLISLAAQKFLSEIVNDTLTQSRRRATTAQPVVRKREKKLTMTMEDLSMALKDYGVVVKKPEYFADSLAAGQPQVGGFRPAPAPVAAPVAAPLPGGQIPRKK